MDTDKTYWIEFINDRSIKVQEGQTILEASLAAGIPHYHACGGKGKCSTCRVMVIRGSENLSPYSSREEALRRKVPIPANVRLACQTFVTGSPVKVHRIIRDEVDIDLYIRKDLEVDVQRVGEERELMLFFLDIRNFTPFMENYLPFDVIHVIRRLFTLFQVSVESGRGKIIETAGDGFYAVFGLDEDLKPAALHAYETGLSILSELDSFNEQYLEKHFFHRFEVGIGLHTGRVIVGNIGIGVNNNLTVMGLPVNIASRLQSATRSVGNSFLVSDQVFRLLPDRRTNNSLEIELKGLRSEIRVHLCGKPFTT